MSSVAAARDGRLVAGRSYARSVFYATAPPDPGDRILDDANRHLIPSAPGTASIFFAAVAALRKEQDVLIRASCLADLNPLTHAVEPGCYRSGSQWRLSNVALKLSSHHNHRWSAPGEFRADVAVRR